MPQRALHLHLLLLLCIFPKFILSEDFESSNCVVVYREGGAPAVFQSPKCPRWNLPHHILHQFPCQSASIQGRRPHQEDRTFCTLDLGIPFPSPKPGLIKEVAVAMVAVFDGHNGVEASDMASNLLLPYFLLHVYFLLDGTYGVVALRDSSETSLRRQRLRQPDFAFHGLNVDFDLERYKLLVPRIFDESFHLEILKESLVRAIRDIDASFAKEAYKNNLGAGTTATVVLIVDGHLLVANIGDSKALMCSEKIQSLNKLKGKLTKLHRRRQHNSAVYSVKEYENSKLSPYEQSAYFCVKELTKDHHPNRADERTRVEAAGGYVVELGGVPRVNGELAISRAIGDISYRSYGVVPVPEMTDWQPLAGNDSYLVVATDGVFEKMTTQDICDLLWDVHMRGYEKSEFCSTGAVSLADCIVNAALEKGSMDNIAAIVVPLRSSRVTGVMLNEGCDIERGANSSTFEQQKLIQFEQANNTITSGIIPVEFVQRITASFKKLLVEAAQNRYGCFYLAENLNENVDHVFLSPKDNQEIKGCDPPQALPQLHGHPPSGVTLGLYNEHNLCLYYGMDTESRKGQCIDPEGFARFLGLLESVPLYDTGYNSSGSFGYETFNFRYMLKRRFDRGSYGEVWMAFHWNCSKDHDIWNKFNRSKACPTNSLHLDQCDLNLQTNSSSADCSTDSTIDDLYILKRIMVERGTAASLSGLREKYFGEVFLNASLSLEGVLSHSVTKFNQNEAEHEPSNRLIQTNDSYIHERSFIWNPQDAVSSNFRLLSADHEEGLMHIARYIESFESRSKEMWLVFRNEGLSLSKLIYTAEETKFVTGRGKSEQTENIRVMHPSPWWHWLRTTEEGKMEMRSILWQLLLALKSCHDRNIIHRDIKPENMVICFEDEDTGKCFRGSPTGEKRYHTKMRIIDFGSAIDNYTLKHLYGSNGPSRSEETFEYTPPEALLNNSWFQGPPKVTMKYDMWSVGVVMLEMILGSPHVFQISARTRALLDKHLEGWGEDIKDLAYKLRSFMEMCILIPGSSPQNHQNNGPKDHAQVWPASWKCSEEYFSYQVKSMDPLKLGFPSVWAMRFVRQLLVWHPGDRLSVDDALQHPYFRSDPQK